MLPSRLLVWLSLAPVVLAVMTLLDHTMLWPMLAVDAGILIMAGIDALWARKPLVEVRRRTRDVFSLGRFNPVELEVRSKASRRLPVEINIDLFDHAVADNLPLRTTLATRGRTDLRFRVAPSRRGAYELGSSYVRYGSPLGLWIRQIEIPDRQPVRVYPDVQQVRTYELLARQDRQHSLMRTSRRLGGESEFEQLREYTRDDEFRSIDWRATARRGEVIARQYQLESNQNLMFMLDAGRLMTAEAGGISLYDHALNATLMLAHVASRGGDKVGLMSFGREVHSFVAPAGGRMAVQRLIQSSYALHPELEEPDFEAAFRALSLRCRQRTLLVMYTQVVDDVAASELVKLTRSVMRRHLPIIVLFRDTDVRDLVVRDTGDPVDLYLRGAAAEVIGWRDQRIRQLENAGALVLDVSPKHLTSKLINRYLEVKARHLL